MTQKEKRQFPVSPEEFTVDWLNAVLVRNQVNATVTDFFVEPIGAGQIADTFRLNLKTKDKPDKVTLSLVTKLPSKDELAHQTAKRLRFYIRETLFYQKLRPLINGKVPKCFFADVDMETDDFCIIMEDASPAQQGDEVKGATVAETKEFLKGIAQIHATFWGNPLLAGFDWLNRPHVFEPCDPKLFKQCWDACVMRFSDRMSKEQLTLGEQFGSILPRWREPYPGKTTLVHLDFRLDNLLINSDNSLNMIVDWQLVGEHCGVIDAAYMIGGALPASERRKYEKELAKIYFNELVSAGVKDYSWDQCWLDYRKYSLWGVMIGVVALSLAKVTDRGNQILLDMAVKHLTQALDLDALSLC